MKKNILPNFALLFTSLFSFYFLIEVILFPLSLQHMPKRLQGYVPLQLYAFMRKTKSGVRPKRYVAILGDSYAVGAGDEWMHIKDWENKGFSSGHRLFKSTGKDFFVLAQSGTGSLGSLLAVPISLFKYLNKTSFYKIPDPEILLVYFYEGNDLDNNIRELRKRFKGDYDMEKLRNKSYFVDFIEKTVLAEHIINKKAGDFHWYYNLFFLRTIYNMMRFSKEDIKRVGKMHNTPSVYKNWVPGDVNRALIMNKETAIPDFLQGPSLELTGSEIETSVYVFARALDYLHDFFPDSKILIVYIPSPLASYDLTSKQVTSQSYRQKNSKYDSDLVRRRSDLINNKIKEVTEKTGGTFIDARDVLRRASAKHFIHGPSDWKHFNQYGYDALTEAIIPYLKD